MSKESRCITPEEADALFNAGIFDDGSPVAITPELLGYSWQSRVPQPAQLPEEVQAAIASAFDAVLKLIGDHRSDPVNCYGYNERHAWHPMLQAWTRDAIIKQIDGGSNLGARFDTIKSKPTPKHLMRRGFYIWNQFTIHGAIKPGFIWFSDAQAASLMSGIMGFEVKEDDIKNDRVHYGIKKMPSEYLIDVSTSLVKCHAAKGMRD